MPAPERRIIVEVVTPEVVARLEAENAALKSDYKQLLAMHQKLHETVYRLMQTIADMRRDKGKSRDIPLK